MTRGGAAWSARPAHTRKVGGSNPPPATKSTSSTQGSGDESVARTTLDQPGEGSPPFPPRASVDFLGGPRKCLCGHLEVHHATRRGRCIGDIRMFISKVPDHALRPGDRILEKTEAEKVVNEAAKKVARAPSYQKQFGAMLQRGFITIPCQCKLYHELLLPNEETGITLWSPGRTP